MKSLTFRCFFSIAFLLCSQSISILAQQSTAVAAQPRGMVVEVTYFKGRAFAYQRVGEWSWYAMFRRPAEWKSRAGELPVVAVKVIPRAEDGAIKARITVLRGKNHEIEDFVADYVLSPERATVIRELTDVGVEPFELLLVRAPSTVADPPSVVNGTKSLQVTVEPAQSSLPTFSARVLNTAPKPVATFYYYTSVEGAQKMSGSPRSENSRTLIEPGDSYQRSFKYPMKPTTVSTGEVPPAISGLVFNVTCVVFTDGTYEGDALSAAHYLAINAGEKAQLKRFLDLVRSKDFTRSEDQIESAIAAVSVDAMAAEFVQKFPELSAEQRATLRVAVDFGKNQGVKLFRGASSEATSALADRLQKRIDLLQ